MAPRLTKLQVLYKYNMNKILEERIRKGHYSNAYNLRNAKNKFFKDDLKKRATKAELIFLDFLKEKQVKHKFQKGFFLPFHRIVDFYIPYERLIVEIDGGYHKDIIQKDYIKDVRWLRERNMRSLRITNEEVYSGEFKQILFNSLKTKGVKDKISV